MKQVDRNNKGMRNERNMSNVIFVTSFNQTSRDKAGIIDRIGGVIFEIMI